MIRALQQTRHEIPFIVKVPDHPDTLRLIRLLQLILDFMWTRRHEIFLLVDNINLCFDLVEAVLDMCQVVYEYYEWLVCTVKYELKPIT